MRVKRYEVGAVPQGNPANEDYFISIRRDNRDITQWDLPLPDAHTIVDELNELQAEVERLRKAGDDLAFRLKDISDEAGLAGFGSVERWNAAKEGKPSA